MLLELIDKAMANGHVHDELVFDFCFASTS